MIAYRTFCGSKWVAWRPEKLHDAWEYVREEAHKFIASELKEDDVISVCESAFGNSPYGFSVTVWYRRP
jgi:hypothetical protein